MITIDNNNISNISSKRLNIHTQDAIEKFLADLTRNRAATKAFGSKIHNIPRARYSAEVDQNVMDFFRKTTEGWSFVEYQDKFRSVPDDEYEGGLIEAINWCNKAYDADSWNLIGNNFIFKNESDAASFIMRFF